MNNTVEVRTLKCDFAGDPRLGTVKMFRQDVYLSPTPRELVGIHFATTLKFTLGVEVGAYLVAGTQVEVIDLSGAVPLIVSHCNAHLVGTTRVSPVSRDTFIPFPIPLVMESQTPITLYAVGINAGGTQRVIANASLYFRVLD